MEQRRIGSFTVTLLGLGTSRLASLGSSRSKADARILLDTARDCGVNFIDTADTYGSTAAERWIGDLTHTAPDYWVVATKTGLPTVDLPGPFRVLNQPAKKVKQVARAGFVLDHRRLRRAIERSLRRLRRERIEIFLLHLPDTGIVNDDEAHEILRAAHSDGLIAEFGVSSDTIMTIRSVREAWGSACAETAVNPLNSTELASGALADLDLIANHVMDARDLREVSIPAGEHGSDGPASSLRARLLRHAAAVPGVKVVLTGTSNPDHLRQNAAAFAHPISDADLIRRP